MSTPMNTFMGYVDMYFLALYRRVEDKMACVKRGAGFSRE